MAEDSFLDRVSDEIRRKNDNPASAVSDPVEDLSFDDEDDKTFSNDKEITTIEILYRIVPRNIIEQLQDYDGKYASKYDFLSIIDMDKTELKRMLDDVTKDLFQLRLLNSSYPVSDDFVFLKMLGKVIVKMLGVIK